MLFDLPIFDPDLGIALCQILDQLQEDDAERLLPFLFTRLTNLPLGRSQFFPGTVESPPVFVSANDEWGFFASAGIQNRTQGYDFVQGYTAPGLAATARPINQWAVAQLGRLAGQPVYQSVLTAPKTIFCGHSAGGVVAMAAGVVRNINRPLPYSGLVTFGSPKPGTTIVETALADWSICRWMNDDDPVPIVPPTFTQSPMMASLVPPQQLRSWGLMAHTHGGRELDHDGNESVAVLPTMAVMSPATNLGAWLWALSQSTATAHKIDEYERRLLLLKAMAIPPNADIVHGAPAQVPVPVPIGEIRQEQAAFINTRLNNGLIPSGTPLIPPEQWFQAVKIGAVWCTRFGRVIISVGPSRRRAGKFAALGNLFLKKMLVQKAFAPDEFLSQMAEFMTMAEDPRSGIKPTLHLLPGV